MSFIDDILNGGIDRDFDGDIDKQDRDIMFAEESIAEKQKWCETTYAYDYDDETDDCFDDETDRYDIAEPYSSYQHIKRNKAIRIMNCKMSNKIEKMITAFFFRLN